MAGVAEALQVIHGAGVVHRDLKPSNVVLAPDGPRVIDFGIARAVNAGPMTGGGFRIGSPQYMAPEQVADSPVGPAADVFALGSVAAYAVLGRPPFGEGGALPVMYRVLHEPADLSGCPAPMRGIIERCLAKKAPGRPSPAEVISWYRAATVGRTSQIAQPWLPPGVAAAQADRPLPPRARVGARAHRQADAAPPERSAPNVRGAPAAVITRQRRTPASTAVSPQPTARLLTRRRRRPARLAAAILGLLVLPTVALAWLADSNSPAGHLAHGRTSPDSTARS